MRKRGFSFVEVLTPCPTAFGRQNRMRSALDILKFYHQRSVIRNYIDPKEATLDFSKNLVLGKFVDIERPTFVDNCQVINRREIGSWPDLQKAAVSTEKQTSR
jgi:2-oxoglutarate ferredoxin oxidoreductase subunit beta